MFRCSVTGRPFWRRPVIFYGGRVSARSLLERRDSGMAIHPEPLDGGVFVYVDDACTFGADALLLSSFARPAGWGSARDRERIADLGTGTGILPLSWFASPRSPVAPPVEAVELDPDAAALAARSVLENGLDGRIRITRADWAELPPRFEAGSFDRVVCNPPYFASNSGKKSGGIRRRLARFESGDGFSGVAGSAARLLKNGGRFCFCHRPERLAEIFACLRGAGLEPKRLQFAHHRPGGSPFLFLCEARKNGRAGLQVEPPLFLQPLPPAPDLERKEDAVCPAP